MRSSQTFWRLGIATLAVCLCSCDANMFGPEARELAGGYRLKKSDHTNEYAVTIPYQSGGVIVDEIGWRKPFIIARGSGSQYWEVINTARAQHTRISDRDLKADPTFQSIAARPPEVAWKELNPRTPLW